MELKVNISEIFYKSEKGFMVGTIRIKETEDEWPSNEWGAWYKWPNEDQITQGLILLFNKPREEV
jgi:hypothetical protein